MNETVWSVDLLVLMCVIFATGVIVAIFVEALNE
jgi:hypothetical protein